jgi:hypothetical protein
MFRMRFDMSELRSRALAAIDDVAEQAKSQPIPRQLAIRFALAFLANFADERWPFGQLLARYRRNGREGSERNGDGGAQRYS